MNALDIAVLAVLALFAIMGYRRGLVRTVYRLISFALALFLAVRLHPYVTRFLRNSFVYEGIRGRIARSANFDAVFTNYAQGNEATRGSNMINALPMPQPMRNLIYESNTPQMRDVLRVDTVEDFIAGFFANIVLNVISLVVVFILVLLILNVVGRVLKIVEWIPIVSSFNRIGGLAAGLLIGVGIAWLGLTVVTMFFSSGGNNALYELLQGSAVVRWVFGNGWMLPRVTAV